MEVNGLGNVYSISSVHWNRNMYSAAFVYWQCVFHSLVQKCGSEWQIAVCTVCLPFSGRVARWQTGCGCRAEEMHPVYSSSAYNFLSNPGSISTSSNGRPARTWQKLCTHSAERVLNVAYPAQKEMESRGRKHGSQIQLMTQINSPSKTSRLVRHHWVRVRQDVCWGR